MLEQGDKDEEGVTPQQGDSDNKEVYLEWNNNNHDPKVICPSGI